MKGKSKADDLGWDNMVRLLTSSFIGGPLLTYLSTSGPLHQKIDTNLRATILPYDLPGGAGLHFKTIQCSLGEYCPRI